LRPDLTLLLDAPVQVGMNRAAQRGKLDRFELEKITFFEKVRAAYLAMAEQQPARIKVIDAAQNLEHVQAKIYQLITQFLHD
jgi:dTMP kinase